MLWLSTEGKEGIDFMKNTVPKVSVLNDWNSAKIQYDIKERWADSEADLCFWKKVVQ